ncbi:MAG: hypothetical protein AAF320_05505 [Myxococcota bacterium]
MKHASKCWLVSLVGSCQLGMGVVAAVLSLQMGCGSESVPENAYNSDEHLVQTSFADTHSDAVETGTMVGKPLELLAVPLGQKQKSGSDSAIQGDTRDVNQTASPHVRVVKEVKIVEVKQGNQQKVYGALQQMERRRHPTQRSCNSQGASYSGLRA